MVGGAEGGEEGLQNRMLHTNSKELSSRNIIFLHIVIVDKRAKDFANYQVCVFYLCFRVYGGVTLQTRPLNQQPPGRYIFIITITIFTTCFAQLPGITLHSAVWLAGQVCSLAASPLKS